MRGLEIFIHQRDDSWRVIIRVNSSSSAYESEGKPRFGNREHAVHHANELAKVMAEALGERDCLCLEVA